MTSVACNPIVPTKPSRARGSNRQATVSGTDTVSRCSVFHLNVLWSQLKLYSWSPGSHSSQSNYFKAFLTEPCLGEASWPFFLHLFVYMFGSFAGPKYADQYFSNSTWDQCLKWRPYCNKLGLSPDKDAALGLGRTETPYVRNYKWVAC